jgi:hypothetical protein
MQYSMIGAALDRARILEVLEQLGRSLQGDWLLVGGALVSIWVESRRTTEDIDLIGLKGESAERFALMDAVHGLGLPIETVNSAADYFVYRTKGWRREIEIWSRFERCTIYRPTVTLFVLLKMHRLSEQDLDDCLAVIMKARAEGLRLDTERLRSEIAQLPPSEDKRLLTRRETLSERLVHPNKPGY